MLQSSGSALKPYTCQKLMLDTARGEGVLAPIELSHCCAIDDNFSCIAHSWRLHADGACVLNKKCK